MTPLINYVYDKSYKIRIMIGPGGWYRKSSGCAGPAAPEQPTMVCQLLNVLPMQRSTTKCFSHAVMQKMMQKCTK